MFGNVSVFLLGFDVCCFFFSIALNEIVCFTFFKLKNRNLYVLRCAINEKMKKEKIKNIDEKYR